MITMVMKIHVYIQCEVVFLNISKCISLDELIIILHHFLIRILIVKCYQKILYIHQEICQFITKTTSGLYVSAQTMHTGVFFCIIVFPYP